jgi:chromosome partitioning protein
MGKVVGILSGKGGVGKSTHASNIASFFQKNFQTRENGTLIIDSDSIGTLRNWRERDVNDLQPPVVGIDRPTLHVDIPKLTHAFDYIFIDGSAKLTDMDASAVKVADVILIPVAPSAADIWGSMDLVELIKARQTVTNGKPKAAFLINGQIKGTKVAKDVDQVLKELGLPVFKARACQRVIYSDAMGWGSTVIDAEPNGKAAQEIAAISHELLEFINE